MMKIQTSFSSSIYPNNILLYPHYQVPFLNNNGIYDSMYRCESQVSQICHHKVSCFMCVYLHVIFPNQGYNIYALKYVIDFY